MYMPHFVRHSPVREHSICFQVLAITNYVSMNIYVTVYLNSILVTESSTIWFCAQLAAADSLDFNSSFPHGWWAHILCPLPLLSCAHKQGTGSQPQPLEFTSTLGTEASQTVAYSGCKRFFAFLDTFLFLLIIYVGVELLSNDFVFSFFSFNLFIYSDG